MYRGGGKFSGAGGRKFERMKELYSRELPAVFRISSGRAFVLRVDKKRRSSDLLSGSAV